MSKVIVKMDSKVLDDLVRKEILDFDTFIWENNWNRMKKDEWWNFGVTIPEQIEISTSQLYDLYKSKSQSKEKVNED